MSAYDGDHRTTTLIDCTVLDLYWAPSLGCYVTIPTDDDDEEAR